MSKTMRLSNKEKSLIEEFKTINSYNKNIAQKFFIDNYIDNKYLTLGKKYGYDHNFTNSNIYNNFDRFKDILDYYFLRGFYVKLNLDEEFYNKYILQSSNQFIIKLHNNISCVNVINDINIQSKYIFRTKSSNNLHSIDELNQENILIQESLKEVLEVFEELKENYTNKFELIKNQFKSYDEIFLKYDLLVKDWKFKNS